MAERADILASIAKLIDASRTLQMEIEHQPEGWQSGYRTNKTAVAKAAARERQAVRELLRTLGERLPTGEEMESVGCPRN